MKSAARLIAAGGARGGVHRVGIEIRLSPRTVTYWRSPGDAGRPPVASFEGSQNLARGQLLFPAPSRIEEDGIEAFGYLDHVIFPVRVVAANPAEPVVLHLKLEYAACERICVPVHAELELALPASTEAGPFAADLAAAERRVPHRTAVGANAALRIDRIFGAAGDWAAGKGHFMVGAHVPAGTRAVTLFTEAPSGWYAPPAQAAPQPDGRVTLRVEIVQAPSGAVVAKAPFVLTLVAGTGAIEVPVRLDSKDGVL